jgi:hypothetical protein
MPEQYGPNPPPLDERNFCMIAYHAADECVEKVIGPAFDGEGLLPLNEEQKQIIVSAVAHCAALVASFVNDARNDGADCSALDKMSQERFNEMSLRVFPHGQIMTWPGKR